MPAVGNSWASGSWAVPAWASGAWANVFAQGPRRIQHLNFVVYQSYDALLAAGQDDGANRDEDGGVPWVDDPSTANGPATTMGPGVGGSAPGGDGGTGGTPGPTRPGGGGLIRRVPPGGSGVQRNRRRPGLLTRLTITASDQIKATGSVFSWAGNEFTYSTLLSGDTVTRADFSSPGAGAGAAAGTYPIYVTQANTSVRTHYSVRYVAGTLTVGAGPGNIAFVRKAQYGAADPATGVISWALPTPPDNNNTVLLLVLTLGSGNGVTGGVAPTFGTPTNNAGGLYTRVGGPTYQAEFGSGTAPSNSDFLLTAWTRKANAGADEGTIKVNVTGAGSVNTDVQLIALEYTNVSNSTPVSNVKKAELSDPSTPIRPMTLPSLDLDGTTGQAVVYVFFSDNSGNTLVSAGYTARYGHLGDDTLDGVGASVADKVGVSGIGPVSLSENWSGGAPTGRLYCGMAIALTR